MSPIGRAMSEAAPGLSGEDVYFTDAYSTTRLTEDYANTGLTMVVRGESTPVLDPALPHLRAKYMLTAARRWQASSALVRYFSDTNRTA